MSINSLAEQIRNKRGDPQALAKLLPIVRSSFVTSKYESQLITRLRDKNSDTVQFRHLTHQIAQCLVAKIVDCLPAKSATIHTPISKAEGMTCPHHVDIVSVLRSGDAFLEAFITQFPEAGISKILIQRDERTAKPHFLYMKLSQTLAKGYVVIAEPMVATGGTLEKVIRHLQEKGVKEDHIIIASICAAPEGLAHLSHNFPNINVVMMVLDEKLDDKKFIVPGLGDFGDRYFGT